MLVFLTILFLLFFVVSIVYWSIKNGIPPTPTSPKVKAQLLKIPLRLESGIIYELGAGWGALAFAYAKKYPTLQVKAYETSWIPYAFCRLRIVLSPQPNLQFYRIDFFTIRLDDAALVVCYLHRAAMKKLQLKFDKELSSKCIVISHTFKIYGRTPDSIVEVADLYRTKIYVYHWRPMVAVAQTNPKSS